MHLPDDIFKNIVAIWADYEGGILRESCDNATHIVEGIFQGTIDTSVSFAIEHVEREQIIEYPEGSPELPKLLSMVSYTLPNPNATVGSDC